MRVAEARGGATKFYALIFTHIKHLFPKDFLSFDFPS